MRVRKGKLEQGEQDSLMLELPLKMFNSSHFHPAESTVGTYNMHPERLNLFNTTTVSCVLCVPNQETQLSDFLTLLNAREHCYLSSTDNKLRVCPKILLELFFGQG